MRDIVNIFLLEELKTNLNSKLLSERAPFRQLELLNNFFEEVLITNDENILEIFLVEFSLKYKICISNLRALGLDPYEVESKLNSTKRIWQKSDTQLSLELTNEFERIEQEIKIVKASLNGEIVAHDKNLLSFPVSIHNNGNKGNYGQIETFRIKIYKDLSLKENKFLIVPSTEKLEKRFEEQIKISWEIAINYLKTYYKKPNKYHEIVLVFSHKFANIEGYSLGFAISLGFIQELFKFYNTSLSLSLNGNVTFTGGFNSNQTIKPIGEEIITQKIETVFFSPFNYFVLPDDDLIVAKSRINELQIKFPNKKLKIISIQDFDDLINHRQIIKINKAKIAVRTKKYLKKNSVAIALLITILFLIGFYFTTSIDNNPNEFKIVGKTVNVTNKYGKILWSFNTIHDEKTRTQYGNNYQKIIDIDNDGINEVIISHETLENSDMENQGRIACFNSKKKLLWKYKFRDSVLTKNENYKDRYISRIIDIVPIDGKNVVVAVSKHNFFPSAIYKLDASNGKRLKGTIWSQGHINTGRITDYDYDGNYDVFVGGINNGLESAFILLTTLDTIDCQTPSLAKYMFQNIKIGEFTKFILFPKTDLCKLYENRFNGTIDAQYFKETKAFEIVTNEYYPNKNIGPQYMISKDLDSAWIQIGDDFQFVRDSLVTKKLLKPPFTNDPDYSKILVDNLKMWNGEKFVKFYAKD